MKQRFFALALVALLFSAPAAWAAGIVPYSGTVTWNSWGSGQIGPATYSLKNHFWNNESNDVGECNIGYWISGLPGCNVPDAWSDGFRYDFYSRSPHLTPDYFGVGLQQFGFEATGETLQVTAELQIAKWARTGENIFGWYEIGGTGGGVLFYSGYNPDGTQRTNLGNTATFTPTGPWGFYLTSPSGTFTTSNTLIDSASIFSHFAVFAVDPTAGHYIVGIEDNVVGKGGDFDYNDLIISVQPVPEPASMVLFGSGLVGLAAAVRRRRRK